MKERQTIQKQMIYEALTTLDHPTATEVYAQVRAIQPTVSRATVFRVLGGFAENGKAREIRLAGSEVRYDFRLEPHFHARCLSCGKVTDVFTEPLLPNKSLLVDGFIVEGYDLQIFGKCHSCNEN